MFQKTEEELEAMGCIRSIPWALQFSSNRVKMVSKTSNSGIMDYQNFIGDTKILHCFPMRTAVQKKFHISAVDRALRKPFSKEHWLLSVLSIVVSFKDLVSRHSYYKDNQKRDRGPEGDQ